MRSISMIFVFILSSTSLFASGDINSVAMDNSHAIAGFNQGIQANQENQGNHGFFNWGSGNPQSLFQFNVSTNSIFPNKSDAEIASEKEKTDRTLKFYNDELAIEEKRIKSENPDWNYQQVRYEAEKLAGDKLNQYKQKFDNTGADLAKTAALVGIVVLPIALVGGVGYIAYNSVIDKENQLSNDLDDRIKNIYERVYHNAQILVDGYREAGIFEGMSDEERTAEIRKIFAKEGAVADQRADDLKKRYEAARNGSCIVM